MDSAVHHCTVAGQTDGPPHPPRLLHITVAETPFMAAGWGEAVESGGRPARTIKFLAACGLRSTDGGKRRKGIGKKEEEEEGEKAEEQQEKNKNK